MIGVIAHGFRSRYVFFERHPTLLLAVAAFQKLARNAYQKPAQASPLRIEFLRMVDQPHEHVLGHFGGFYLIAGHQPRETKDTRLMRAIDRRERIAVPSAESPQQLEILGFRRHTMLYLHCLGGPPKFQNFFSRRSTLPRAPPALP